MDQWGGGGIHLIEVLVYLCPHSNLSDPNWLLIMKTDTLNIMAGAVILQRDSMDQKVHLCAYFSRWLAPAKLGYDVVNNELAVVVVLQEWRHWLEGAINPFLVWTNLKKRVFSFPVPSGWKLQKVWWVLFPRALNRHPHLLTTFTKYKTRRLSRASLPGTQSHPVSLLYCGCKGEVHERTSTWYREKPKTPKVIIIKSRNKVE